MTDTNNAATIDQRLAEFAERVRKLALGEQHAETVAEVQANIADWGTEPWRIDMRAELLHLLLDQGGQIVEDMRRAHYAALPQDVREADTAAHEAARAKRAAGWNRLRAEAA